MNHLSPELPFGVERIDERGERQACVGGRCGDFGSFVRFLFELSRKNPWQFAFPVL